MDEPERNPNDMSRADNGAGRAAPSGEPSAASLVRAMMYRGEISGPAAEAILSALRATPAEPGARPPEIARRVLAKQADPFVGDTEAEALARHVLWGLSSAASSARVEHDRLAAFFRNEEIEWGLKGYYEGWSTEQAAIELIRHLRAARSPAPAGDGETGVT
jgi:hypothetical protein